MEMHFPELARLVDFVPYALTLWGLVYLLTQSVIFVVLRVLIVGMAMFVSKRLGSFVAVGIYCPACVSFWFGLGLGALGLWPFKVLLWAPIEAAIASVALGALWTRIGPENNAWSIEIGDRFDNPQQKEES